MSVFIYLFIFVLFFGAKAPPINASNHWSFSFLPSCYFDWPYFPCTNTSQPPYLSNFSLEKQKGRRGSSLADFPSHLMERWQSLKKEIREGYAENEKKKEIQKSKRGGGDTHERGEGERPEGEETTPRLWSSFFSSSNGRLTGSTATSKGTILSDLITAYTKGGKPLFLHKQRKMLMMCLWL